MSEENLHSGHRQRMRERIKKHGAQTLEDHELLEVLLYYCIPRKNTNPIAHKLLKEYGSMHELLTADYTDIMEKGEISENAAIFLSLAVETAKRLNEVKLEKGELIKSPSIAGKRCIELLKFEKREVFYLLAIDPKGRLINACELNRGSVTGVSIDSRKLIETAVKQNADRVILLHNHPGGNVKPSPADILLTNEAIKLLKTVKISVMDHIIVNESEYYSFKDNELI